MQKAFSILLFLLLVNPCHAQKKAPGQTYFSVIRIIDGDTFVINDGSPKGATIRLIGVDAPESRNSRNKVKTEFGAVATKYLEEMIASRRVRLEYDVDRTDQYKRTLAYVYLEDGTFVNAELVKNGYANVMTVPPNVKYQEFSEIAGRARSRGRGALEKRDSEYGVEEPKGRNF